MEHTAVLYCEPLIGGTAVDLKVTAVKVTGKVASKSLRDCHLVHCDAFGGMSLSKHSDDKHVILHKRMKCHFRPIRTK